MTNLLSEYKLHLMNLDSELAELNPGMQSQIISSLRNFEALQDSFSRARLEQGKSQQQVADLLGITQPAVSAFESSGSAVKIQTLILFAAAYGLELDFILRDQRSAESKNPTSA